MDYDRIVRYYNKYSSKSRFIFLILKVVASRGFTGRIWLFLADDGLQEIFLFWGWFTYVLSSDGEGLRLIYC